MFRFSNIACLGKAKFYILVLKLIYNVWQVRLIWVQHLGGNPIHRNQSLVRQNGKQTFILDILRKTKNV